MKKLTNIRDIQISVKYVLSLGRQFCIRTAICFPMHEILASTESGIGHFANDDKNTIKKKIYNVLTNYGHRFLNTKNIQITKKIIQLKEQKNI